jgi:uncharacterized protein
MKLLVLLVVGYFCYRAIKNWMMTGASMSDRAAASSGGEIDDVMIQDPVCGVYVPKENSIGMRYQGEELFFCSQKCKATFIHNHKEA